MDIRKKYTEETGKLYYKEATLEFEWDGDYVEWLEQNLVKLFAIPAVVGRSEQLRAFKQFLQSEYHLPVSNRMVDEFEQKQSS